MFAVMTADVTPIRWIPEWTFGERIAKARKSSGYNQEQMAERLRITASRLKAWETDRNRPRDLTHLVEQIEAITGVSRMWLLGWEEPSPQGGPGVVGEEGLEPPTVRVNVRPLFPANVA